MSFQIKIIIFALGSAGFIWLSWSSLSRIRSHGFYRFFGFESLLALILLHVDHWFSGPFSAHQLISWILLLISVGLVIHGIVLLSLAQRSGFKRDDPTLFGIEKTTELITTGAYRYIRHPIYSSGIIGAWGIFFKKPSLEGGLLAVLTAIFFTLTAKMEEAENIGFFGEAYQTYMKRTKMFIPYLF